MLWKNAWIPGTCIAFWRRRAITTGAGSRSFFGFRAMNRRPKLAVGFGPPAPAVLLIYSTAGSWLQDVGERLLPDRHRFKRRIGRGLGNAGQKAGILLREKSLGHDDIERDGADERQERHHQHHGLAGQHPVERPFVGAEP